jgi:hypothetical protein
MNSPHFLLAVSAILMLVGMILPFLIVIQVLESTFFLNFFSWGRFRGRAGLRDDRRNGVVEERMTSSAV